MRKVLVLVTMMLLPLTASAYSAVFDGITYDLDSESKTAKVVSSSNKAYSGTIVIPQTVNGDYSVTSIGNSAFSECTKLTSVTIPKSVTSIEAFAFYKCTGLTSMTIPSSVSSIGDYAFSGCNDFSANIIVMDLSAFCNNIVNKSLHPQSCHLFDKNGFPIIYYNIPDDVTSIGEDAFYNCASLKTVSIPSSVTSIGGGAFVGCKGLSYICIPNSVTSIGESAFHYCTGLTSVIGSLTTSIAPIDGVKTIDERAFYGCNQLASVAFGNDLTSIGMEAFSGCSSLKSVTFHCGVTSIGWHAFYDCKSLQNINLIVSDLASFCNNIIGGLIRNTIGLVSVHLMDNEGKEIEDLIIPEGVASIASNAFFKCSGLKSVMIPSSVTSVKKEAFAYCSNLASVSFGSNIITMEDGSFYECNNIADVKVTVTDYSAFCTKSGAVSFMSRFDKPVKLIDIEGNEIKNFVVSDDVTSIGNNAFRNCSGLEILTIGNKVTSIGDNAFEGTNLKKTIWKMGTPPSGYENVNGTIVNYVPNDQFSKLSNTVVYPFINSMFEVEGIKYVPVSTSELTCDAIDCANDESVKNLKIPSKVKYKNKEFTVKKILPYFAQYNDYIETLTIDRVSEILDKAFYDCRNLTSITLSMSITAIARNALPTNRIPSLRISPKVVVTDFSAFCTELGTVYSLKDYLAAGEITLIDGNGNEIKEFNLPDDVTSIADYAFYNCGGLTSVKISNSVTSIGTYAFSNCRSLASVTIPSSLTSIEGYAFKGCTNLNSVYITDLASWCKIIGLNRFDSNPLFYAHHLFLNKEEIKNLVIPDDVESICDGAFRVCSGLTSVTIPNSVTSIGGSAFSGCSGLTSVTIPNSVETIGDYTFSGCSSLTSVTIPNSVTSIGGSAFSGCSGLTSVTIPNSVETIGGYTFSGCSSLTSVTIPNSVTSIRSEAFQGCSSLTSITIPNSVTSIGSSAFDCCI